MCRLFQTDVYALRVKPFLLHQPDELAAPAATVDDGPGRERQQQETDLTLVHKSGHLVSARSRRAACVRLVEMAPQVAWL
jgi:hypothetical protein